VVIHKYQIVLILRNHQRLKENLVKKEDFQKEIIIMNLKILLKENLMKIILVKKIL
jgi:metal-responsive CopG/Arc/MetJ family transcriptional regulator